MKLAAICYYELFGGGYQRKRNRGRQTNSDAMDTMNTMRVAASRFHCSEFIWCQ